MYSAIGILALVIMLILLFYYCKKWLQKMNDEDVPDDVHAWRVGDLKKYLKDLPDDMPVILLDTSTDSVEHANYAFFDDDIYIDDYYIEDAEDDTPAGKAVFLCFENRLNDDPISNYPINLN